MAVLSNTWNDRLIDSIFVLPLLNFSMMEKNFENQVFNRIKKRCTVLGVMLPMCLLGLLWRGEGRGSGITPSFEGWLRQYVFPTQIIPGSSDSLGCLPRTPTKKKKDNCMFERCRSALTLSKNSHFFIIAPRNWWHWKTIFFSAFFVWEASKVVPMFKGQNSLNVRALVFFGWFDELVTSDP